MIIKIERGDSAEGLLRYLRRSDRSAEEQANVRIFDLHRITHIENAAARLDRAAARSGLSKPIVHIIIRAERALTDPEKRIAITAVRKELGLELHPGVAVVHDPDQDTGQTAFLEDTRTEHLHLESCAANDTGETPPRILYSRLLERAVTPGEAKYLPKGDVRSRSWDSYSQRRLMAVARKLEDQFGLRPLARNRQEQAEEKRELVKVSTEAQARWKRDGTVPLLRRIDIAAAKAALHRPAWDDKIAALAQIDLTLEPIFAKNGQLRGLRLVARDNPSIYCAASDLGSNYGRAALDKRSDRPFADWYATSGRTPFTAAPARKGQAVTSGVEAEYQAYTRQQAAEREVLRRADADLRAWRRKERDAAHARKEARWPHQRHRTARPLRAEILQAYRAECAVIEREYEAQRDVLAQRRTRKLTYQEWLTTQTSPAAAERLQLLSRRSVPNEAKAPTNTMPSGAALAAAAEEQSARRRAAEEIVAEHRRLAAVRDRQRDLAERLSALGIALVTRADAENRRVAVEDRAIRIDDRALHTAEPGSDDPVLQAGVRVAESQRVEVQTLPLMIKAALGLPPRPDETPRLWLDRLFHQPRVARWLDKDQIAAVQQRWGKDAEEAWTSAGDPKRMAETPSAEQGPSERHSRGEAAPPARRPVAPAALLPSTSGVGAPKNVPASARLMRMSQVLDAEGSILQRGSAVDALAARLDTIGVKLIIDADRQDRRVRVEPEVIRIDGASLMSVPPAASPLPVLAEATATQARQVAEERTLAIAIHCAAGLPPRGAEMPACWLQRIYGKSMPTRWLTAEQDADIRRMWEPLLDGTPPGRPPIDDVSPERGEVGSLPSPPVTHSTQPRDIAATINPPAERLPASPAERPEAPPAVPREPPQARPHVQVYEAMAMMKNRPVPAAPDVPTQDVRKTIAPEPTAPVSPPAEISAAGPALHRPETGATLPQRKETGETLSRATDVPSPAPIELPGPVTMPRLVEPRPPASDDTHVMKQWLIVSHAAHTDPGRQQDSEALAARLVVSDVLGLIDADLQLLAERQAEAHQQRQASEARRAAERLLADEPAAVTPPPERVPSADGAPDTGTATRPAPQHAKSLRHLGNTVDPWQRS